MTPTYLRMSININRECADILAKCQAEHQISATEAVRHAIGLLGLAEETSRQGGTLYTKDQQGQLCRMELVW